MLARCRTCPKFPYAIIITSLCCIATIVTHCYICRASYQQLRSFDPSARWPRLYYCLVSKLPANIALHAITASHLHVKSTLHCGEAFRSLGTPNAGERGVARFVPTSYQQQRSKSKRARPSFSQCKLHPKRGGARLWGKDDNVTMCNSCNTL
jgi:hypothetical protein